MKTVLKIVVIYLYFNIMNKSILSLYEGEEEYKYEEDNGDDAYAYEDDDDVIVAPHITKDSSIGTSFPLYFALHTLFCYDISFVFTFTFYLW